VFLQALKWLRDVTTFANVGNQGEFMRVLDRQSPLQENNALIQAKNLPANGAHPYWHSDDGPCPDNVVPLR
jgi:hypothetical protein